MRAPGAAARRRSRGNFRIAAITGGLLLAVQLGGLGCSSENPGTGTSSGGAGGAATAGSAGSSATAGASGAAVGSAGAGAGAGGAAGSAVTAGAGGDSAGGGTPAGGNAGAGGAASVMWTTNGSKYSVTVGSTYFEVDAGLGGRITSLKAGGQELLADAATTKLDYYWGSTFWPSPQALFNLPPTDPSISNIDRKPYTAQLDGALLTLTSALNLAAPKLVVTKKFSADVAKEAIVIEYTMTNGGTGPLTVAPWEVTRVAGGGLTFYPEASAPVLHDQAAVMPPTTLASGVRWFQHNPKPDDKATKFFADGQGGWVAHATGAAKDLLLIKTFPDIAPNQSPAGESEIEIFAVPTYVEVEQQGAVETLPVGGSSTHWTVRWYARKLASPAAVGSADLVTFVQNQIK